MFGFIVVSFAVCWLPYHIYFLYTYHDKDIVGMAMFGNSHTDNIFVMISVDKVDVIG